MGAARQASRGAYGRRSGSVERVSGALRSRAGRIAGKAAAGVAAIGDGGAYAGRSSGDAGLASGHGEVATICGEKEISGEVAMLCDKYKEALIEAAASGAALPISLREHVDACGRCRATLATEQTLFAAIDAGLHRAANAKVRDCFLPKVKANLAGETVPARNPIPRWAFVCATGALVLAAALLNLPRSSHDEGRTEGIIASSELPTGVGGRRLSLVPAPKTFFSARTSKAPNRQNVSHTNSHEPAAVIQPEKEETLKRFHAHARNRTVDGRAIARDEQQMTPKSVDIEQIEVKNLTIENLE